MHTAIARRSSLYCSRADVPNSYAKTYEFCLALNTIRDAQGGTSSLRVRSRVQKPYPMRYPFHNQCDGGPHSTPTSGRPPPMVPPWHRHSTTSRSAARHARPWPAGADRQRKAAFIPTCGHGGPPAHQQDRLPLRLSSFAALPRSPPSQCGSHRGDRLKLTGGLRIRNSRSRLTRGC